MAEDEQGVFIPFERLLGDLSKTLEKGFDRAEKRSDQLEAKLDRQFEDIRQLLDGKADLTRVADLEKKLAEHESYSESRYTKYADLVDKRLKPLEEQLIGSRAASGVKDKGLAFLAALVVAIISALIYVGSTGGFH